MCEGGGTFWLVSWQQGELVLRAAQEEKSPSPSLAWFIWNAFVFPAWEQGMLELLGRALNQIRLLCSKKITWDFLGSVKRALKLMAEKHLTQVNNSVRTPNV